MTTSLLPGVGESSPGKAGERRDKRKTLAHTAIFRLRAPARSLEGGVVPFLRARGRNGCQLAGLRREIGWAAEAAGSKRCNGARCNGKGLDLGRIRGVVDPFPKRGKPPTGMFSSKGSQKYDGNDASAADLATMRAAHKADRVDPVGRDNRISGVSQGPSSQSKNGGK